MKLLHHLIFYFFLFIISSNGLSQTKQLNVLLFTADDLDRNSLGCYGSAVPDISPNIDKFATEGKQFMKAYVNVAICAPSRGVIATGLYGHNSGVKGFMKMEENSQIPLIMEILRTNNYQVGILGKVGHSTPKKDFMWDFTYDMEDLGMGRSPSLYYSKSVDFFSECKKLKKPFYFMVNSHDPHRPFHDPSIPLKDGIESPSRIYNTDDVSVPGFLPDLPKVRTEITNYYNSVKRLDDTFGRVMQALEESGFRDNTIVIFISDNGMAFPFAKCDNYYASNRTPWIVRWPGVTSPGTVDTENLLSEVDFMPTILDALHIKTDSPSDGVSRLALYKGEKQENTGIVFTQIDNKARGAYRPMKTSSVPMRGVQTSDFIYIYNFWVNGRRLYANNNEGETVKAMKIAAKNDPSIATRIDFFRYRTPEEFYDLRNDPDCLNNLINNPAYTSEIEKMRYQLKKWMVETHDPLSDVYTNRKNIHKVLPLLYKLYPDLKRVDDEEKTEDTSNKLK